MENIQVNGQRIWGPPKNWTGPPPPHGTEVFVKNIPSDILESELYLIFKTVGPVYEVRVPVFWSGANRGYGFVRYTTAEHARQAVRRLNKFEIRVGWEIKVEKSIDNNRLFLSAVCKRKNGEKLLKDLKTVVENVKKVYVYPSHEEPNLFRGYAFVEFETHRDAAIAKRVLTPDVCAKIFDKRCIAAWATPQPQVPDELKEKINVLFVRNVPSTTKPAGIKSLFEMYIGPGTIDKIKRINDICFITFTSHECADIAYGILKNNPMLLGFDSVDVEWAVPRRINAKSKYEEDLTPSQLPLMYRKSSNQANDALDSSWETHAQTLKSTSDSTNGENLTDNQKYMFDPSEKINNDMFRVLLNEIRNGHVNPKDFFSHSKENMFDTFDLEDINEELRSKYLHAWLDEVVTYWNPTDEFPSGLLTGGRKPRPILPLKKGDFA